MDNYEIIGSSIDKMPFMALVTNLSKNYIKYLNKELEKYNINSIQSLFLVKLNYFDDLSQNDLARIFNLSKGSVAKSLKKLENEGYIIRKTDNEDFRRNIIELTDKSLEIIPKIKEINGEWETYMGISEDSKLNNLIKDLTLKSFKLL
ncbi:MULTISPECIES: MarR family winged helix-turn-helix transcriptional regulator [Methanobrevibacter]|jgi:DNA-binding MarR family transcriptional regulator|uniref:MarR family winged helix-turn-helix transcriptional regulator n=1 Tax=Methanobrevibacter TaxID=2172 RepID=UPI00033481BF|nr:MULTISPECIES: MarR family transcriptional regulator [Methanobrevibacter]AGN17108.1 transcriptional regulator MarR family [Methanobrevibacter sp. AbM4]MDD6255996.1 MarR family transcriptional regulator [Methanobrevibacter boviskoreani]